MSITEEVKIILHKKSFFSHYSYTFLCLLQAKPYESPPTSPVGAILGVLIAIIVVIVITIFVIRRKRYSLSLSLSLSLSKQKRTIINYTLLKFTILQNYSTMEISFTMENYGTMEKTIAL